MTKPALHPWLSTPDAYVAARRATAVPLYKMGPRAVIIGKEELVSEALSLLTECALPPREMLAICAFCQDPMPATRRKGAKYCSPQCSSSYRDNRARAARGEDSAARRALARGQQEQALPHPKTHIGSMHSWPPEEMMAYAIREVGFRLCHFVAHGRLETPASPSLHNLAIAAPGDADDAALARDLIEQWLEGKGVRCAGDETIEELAEAARHLKGLAA